MGHNLVQRCRHAPVQIHYVLSRTRLGFFLGRREYRFIPEVMMMLGSSCVSFAFLICVVGIIHIRKHIIQCLQYLFSRKHLHFEIFKFNILLPLYLLLVLFLSHVEVSNFW